MKISDALQTLCPGARWTLQGNDYSGLIWHDEVISKPTEAEVTDYIARHTYQELRRPLYPSLADFADAYVHAQNGDSAAMDAYIAKCNIIKAQFPKPE